MKKYFVRNGRIVINRYCVKYNLYSESGNTETNSTISQYAINDDELIALTQELEDKNIEFEVVNLEVEDILRFEGLPVLNDSDARKIIEPDLNEVIADKVIEISNICERKIYNGIDVDFGGDIKHFSLKIEDQLNINRLALIYGNDEECSIIYHADGELYQEFSKEDFFKIVRAASDFISNETEYCNRLMRYTKSLETVSDVFSVVYGMEV